MVSTKNPTPIIEAIEYLDKVEFLQEDSFSALSMASVIYCLSHPEPVSAAKMLVRLNALNLLTEQNIGKIDAMPQSTFGFLPKIVHKLNLVEEDGTSHLLNQANLDKLLEYTNLEILAKFIQVEDKSKVFTQGKLDLAFILKQLLTQENIEKIENIALDHSKLTDIFRSFSASSILTQENFNAIIQLSKSNFDTIYQTISLLFHENPYENLLTQQTVDKILGNTAFATEKLECVLSCLDDASILSQANFKTIIGLNKAEFEKNIFPVLSIMHEKGILNEKNFNAFFAACTYDKNGQRVKISEQDLADFLSKNFNIHFYDIKNNSNFNNQSTSMAERLCATLVDLLSRVGKFFQEFFNDTLNFFKEEIKNGEKKDEDEIASVRNPNSFFPVPASHKENITPVSGKENVATYHFVHDGGG